MNLNISVIIPARNEGKTVGGIVGRVRALHPGAEVIVIDDGSTDDTAAAAHAAGARVYRHPYNMGNGAAVKSGIRLGTGDVFVFMDGDGQHHPEDIAGLLAFFPDYDMVVGARGRDGQASFERAVGNQVYNWLASYVAKFRVKDLTSGFRAVKAEIARSYIYLLPNTYSYPTTMTLGVLRDGRSVRYVPIRAGKRTSGKSRISIVKDGVRFFMIIAKICTLYSPMRVFLPVSFGVFVLGLGHYAYTYAVSGRFTNMSALLFMNSLVIFMMGLVSEQICQMRFERRGGDRPARKFEPDPDNKPHKKNY